MVLLNDTKINNSHKINFKNYNFIRNDRKNNKGGGGTGILIKNDIKFVHLPTPKLKSIECSIINIFLENNQSIYVSTQMNNYIDPKTLISF